MLEPAVKDVLQRIRPEVYKKFFNVSGAVASNDRVNADNGSRVLYATMTPQSEMPGHKYTHKKKSLLVSPSTMSNHTIEYRKRKSTDDD